MLVDVAERGNEVAGDDDRPPVAILRDMAEERAEISAAEEQSGAEKRACAARQLCRGAAAEGHDLLIERHEPHGIATRQRRQERFECADAMLGSFGG